MKMQKEVLVSVLCLAYNHEKYIRQALEGFVMQKTDFAFEVLINDDASTDNTAKIIKEYEEKYPQIIKPVYQTENQYSQGIPISKTYLYPKAQGKYFAICEGDDYWTDPLKLQKQVDFLESNPEYAMCVHKATLNDLKTGKQSRFPDISEDRDYSTEEIIIEGGGIFATNSIVAKKEVFTTRPECFKAKGFGDYQMFIYGSIYGKCRCLADNMSVYNYCTAGSWTVRIQDNEAKREEHFVQMLNMLNAVNKYYDYKYNDAITKALILPEFIVHRMNGDKKRMKDKRYRKYYKIYRKSDFRLKLKKIFPALATLRKVIKGKFCK